MYMNLSVKRSLLMPPSDEGGGKNRRFLTEGEKIKTDRTIKNLSLSQLR